MLLIKLTPQQLPARNTKNSIQNLIFVLVQYDWLYTIRVPS